MIMRVTEAPAPTTVGFEHGSQHAECQHVCRYIYKGECYAHHTYHCPIECPSEWCPYCTTDACKTHGDFDLVERCDCDVVERHEDRR